MRVERRKRVAWGSFVILLGAWGLLVGGVFIEASIRGDASDRWLLPFACLAMLVGMHAIYFRHELPEVFEDPRKRRLGLWFVLGANYSSTFFLVGGIAWLIVGVGVIAKLLLSI